VLLAPLNAPPARAILTTAPVANPPSDMPIKVHAFSNAPPTTSPSMENAKLAILSAKDAPSPAHNASTVLLDTTNWDRLVSRHALLTCMSIMLPTCV